jgi:hypothetical protein
VAPVTIEYRGSDIVVQPMRKGWPRARCAHGLINSLLNNTGDDFLCGENESKFESRQESMNAHLGRSRPSESFLPRRQIKCVAALADRTILSALLVRKSEPSADANSRNPQRRPVISRSPFHARGLFRPGSVVETIMRCSHF